MIDRGAPKLIKAGAALIALVTIASSAASAADQGTIACNFRVLTAAQRAAQTDVAAHRVPGLLGQITDTMTPLPLDGVYVSDPAVQRKIMVQDVLARRTPTKSVEVLTRIVNCTDYPLQILGRTSFLDASQFPTESPSAWQPIFLQPHSVGTYKQVSIGGASVSSYLIEMISNR